MTRARSLTLAEAIASLPEADVEGSREGQIRGVECDSRRVDRGCVFVAIRGGQEQDRHQFVSDAVRRGALAVVVEEEVEAGGATRIRVPDARQAMARLAARYYGNPAEALICAAVTGTNGKTTTALLLRSILDAAGIGAAYIGTLGALVGGAWRPLDNTTPEAGHLHRELRAAVDAGQGAVVLEASSHALALGRLAGLRFDVAALTNLTRDHLDFHGSEEAYFEAKARLFANLKEDRPVAAAINAEDQRGRDLLQRMGDRALSFAVTGAADVRPVRVVDGARGTELTVAVPDGQIEVRSSLTGPFNYSNLVAAVTCAVALGIDGGAISSGIGAVQQIPGRFERIDAGQSFRVLVDYAHTPDSLENVLRAARTLVSGRLICLFGCGGDRDRGKRPLMGQVAEALADVTVITSDNPRSEEPAAIIAEIAAGMARPGKARLEPDRETAIRAALEMADDDDIVVLAGKGDETYQAFADRVVEFDDREVARRALSAMSQAS